jgi:hypothetical protein
MAVAWHPDVNKKAYGMDTAPIENVERVEFESGKARTYLKNTAAKKTHSFMLKLEDVGDNSEYKKFVAWWETNLLGGALSFYFPDLITHDSDTEYRPIGTYSATGQKWKEVSITVEEM